ncbi:hypothetical protein VTI74DRAFT_4669 [Chaetomium olivicolor]
MELGSLDHRCLWLRRADSLGPGKPLWNNQMWCDSEAVQGRINPRGISTETSNRKTALLSSSKACSHYWRCSTAIDLAGPRCEGQLSTSSACSASSPGSIGCGRGLGSARSETSGSSSGRCCASFASCVMEGASRRTRSRRTCVRASTMASWVTALPRRRAGVHALELGYVEMCQ